MTQMTIEHLDAALRAVKPQPDGMYSIVDVFNKAQELAEQATQEQFIAAKEAKALGVGNAEWYDAYEKEWKVCGVNCFEDGYRYRAIRKEVPSEPYLTAKESWWAGVRVGLGLSPNTPREEVAKQIPAGGEIKCTNGTPNTLQSQPDIDTLAATQMPVDTSAERKGLGLYTPVGKSPNGEPHAELRALYAQQVKDGTWINHVWAYYDEDGEWIDEYIKPDDSGIGFRWKKEYQYRYKLKANLVKLDDVLMSRDAAIAIWESRKDTCDVWFKSPIGNWVIAIGTDNRFGWGAKDGEYQLRPKAKKPVSWSDMPVGVMTNKGEFRGAYGDILKKLDIETVRAGGYGVILRGEYPKDVVLAPSDQQPWIAAQEDGKALHEGLSYVKRWSGEDDCQLLAFKVIGIADGWELKSQEVEK